jgi:hypothetical protein
MQVDLKGRRILFIGGQDNHGLYFGVMPDHVKFAGRR